MKYRNHTISLDEEIGKFGVHLEGFKEFTTLKATKKAIDNYIDALPFKPIKVLMSNDICKSFMQTEYIIKDVTIIGKSLRDSHQRGIKVLYAKVKIGNTKESYMAAHLSVFELSKRNEVKKLIDEINKQSLIKRNADKLEEKAENKLRELEINVPVLINEN